ncbi:MAG: SDR family oxidoreductase [Armatimonadota bacterium]
MVDQALLDFIKISRAAGCDPLLVQGGGGNTSAKTADGKNMYIKASGTALKDASETAGWRRMSIDQILSVLNDDSLSNLLPADREANVVARLNLACNDGLGTSSRPSVEAHLHAILDNYVIHIHPEAVGAYVCAKNGRAALESMFKDQPTPPLWVPYVDPGYTLGAKVNRLVTQYRAKNGRKPEIIFLEKHGLFVTAPTVDKTLTLVDMVINRCRTKLPVLGTKNFELPTCEEIETAKLAIRCAVYIATDAYVNIEHFIDDEIAAFMQREDADDLLSLPGLTPDELVYSSGPPLWLKTADSGSIIHCLKQQIAKGEKHAVSFMVKGLGLFVAGNKNTIPVVHDIAKMTMNVRVCAANFGGVNPLNNRQRDFITNWEAESFRKNMVASSGGELTGCIAVVSGAGSGLGKGIATGLVKAGATVVFADIDIASAEQVVSDVQADIPGSQAVTLKCDVTSEESVEAGFKDIVNRFGGLDILVNAAGIAPAYPLVDLPLSKWQLTLDINLTGYFLMARSAARIMIKQGIGGNIINLSSKSGLDASKSNTPYNATKSAELHMARGWALELGPHGIRVNSIAPGNVFEGSKIWNPQYIQESANKYGIKPEEVIPFYIDKTALKREIKGQDIADSVVFLCSNKANTITGQTLVVDSGQVMVR